VIAAGASGDVLLELGVVLLVLAVVGRAAGRIGIPSVPLYLLAGLAMGEGGLVPLNASDDFIRVGADVSGWCCCSSCLVWSTTPRSCATG